MIIQCNFEQVPALCAALVKLGVEFTCRETCTSDMWLITFTGGY